MHIASAVDEHCSERFFDDERVVFCVMRKSKQFDAIHSR